MGRRWSAVLLVLCAYFVLSNCDLIELRTDVERLHSYFPLGKTHFEFSVNATRDVHVLFNQAPYLENHWYEIVLGGWANTKSLIRVNWEARKEINGNIMDPNGNFMTFWVKVDHEEGSISIGKKNQKALMKYVDPNYLEVRYFGFSTGYGAKGTWRFDSSVIKCDDGVGATRNTYYSVFLSSDGRN